LLPPVVAADRLSAAYRATEQARQAERARGDACAEATRRLQQWIKEHAT
jgi:hypothetical protein